MLEGLGGLGTSYYEGQEQQYKQRLRQPVSDLDPAALLKQGARVGGLEFLKPLLPYMMLAQSGGQTAQSLSDLERQVSGGQPTSPVSAPNQAQGAGPANIIPQARVQYPQEGTQGTSVNILATELSGGQDVQPIISRVSKILGVDPAAQLPPAAVAPAKAMLARAIRPAESAVTTPGRSELEAPAGPTSAVERNLSPLAGRQGAAGAPAPVTNAPGTAMPASGIVPTVQPTPPPISGPGPVQAIQQAQADPVIRALLTGAARAREIAAADAIRNPQASQAALQQASAYEARARIMLEAASKAAEPTPAMREAATAGVPLEQYAGEQEAYKKYGEAKGKRIGEVVEAGGLPARQTVRTLNTMEEAMRAGGRSIWTGPGGEYWLKVKQGANNLWPGFFQGVPESETVVKLNAQLASEAAKSMTARPSQLEFRAFMQNNPGLMTSREGTLMLISILRQAKEQDIKLSRLAMNQGNLRNWSDVEDRFYADNPIVGPWSQTATNPKTGERLVLSGGRWIPVPK
jgi:hypothetical protein